MNIDLTIHTYGYYDALYYVLNGIAMFRNSSFYSIMVESTALIVVMYHALRMVSSNWRQHIVKVFGIVILINSLLMPKATMQLKDHISKTIGVVDNIPLAFALPVGILENFGYVITRGFEQVFSPIENLTSFGGASFPYYNYGMVFGARLKKEVSDVRIKSPEFIGNMQTFIKQCVMYPAMIGYQFTKEELVSTNDMWKLVSDKAGTLTLVDMNVRGERKLMTCKAAALDYFNGAWQNEINSVIYKYRDTEYGKARSAANYAPPRSTLPEVFEKNVKALYGNSASARDILRQQMMINSFSDYKSSNYGVARARMQQESAGILSSDLASLYLPMMLVIYKCVIYSAFIFLVPLIIAGGGMARYTGYLTLVASLQLWPSINAVLNMIIGTYSNLELGSSMLISYSTASTISSRSDTIVTIAGGLQMTAPFLAYWMTNLGASGISHLAGGMIGAIQSVSGTIGGELSTGNRSLDNISEGNTQTNMRSANKTDFNSQYFDGVNSTQLGDGTIATTFASGSQAFNSSSAHSSGLRKLSLENSMQGNTSKNVEEGTNLVESSRNSFAKAHTSTFGRTVDYVSQVAQQESAGRNIDYGALGEQGKSLQQAVNHTRQLQEQNGYSWGQAATIATRLGFSIGSMFSAGVNGSLDFSNSSGQVLNDGTTVNRDNNINDRYDNLVKVAQNDTWAKNNNIDTSYCEAVRSSYNEEKRAESQLAINEDRLKGYHQAQTLLASQGANNSEDARPELEKRLVQKLGVSQYEAHRMIDEWNPQARKEWDQLVNEQVESMVSKISKGKQELSSSANAEKINKFSQEHGVEDQSGRVKEIMIKENKLNPDEIRDKVDSNRDSIEQKTIKMTEENQGQYKVIKYYNESEEREMAKQSAQYEEDRIGKDAIGSSLGIGPKENRERKNYDRSSPPTHKEEKNLEEKNQKVKK